MITNITPWDRNLLITACSLIFYTAPGQSDSSGIFLNGHDYERNRLTLSVSCKSDNAIRPHHYFRKKIITVRFEGKKYKYSKAVIFGYRNCQQENFRFFLGREYEIINTDGFWLYRQKIESDNWDDYHFYTLYYFSKDPYSIIYPLTKHDLKWIFKENLQFLETLNSSFKSDYDLYSWDSSKKRYRIIEAFLKK